MNFLSINTKTGFNQLRESIANQLVESSVMESSFESYQDDPIRFGEEVLGESYTDDVKELMLSVRDNRATIARSANATGKSHAAARIAIWFLLCFSESQVYTCAAPPESNLRTILWGEIGLLLERHKHLFKGFKLNDLKIQRNPKSFLMGLTIPTSGTPAQREGKFSGKHAPQMLFICDEGDAIPDEVYRGIESCMSGLHERILIMFNPRHEAGAIYIKERDKQARIIELTAFNHPNVITGRNIIAGAVSRETTLRRINEWTRPLMVGEKEDSECFEIPDFLVGTTTESPSGMMYEPMPAGWRRIVDPAFSYMVLAKYPAAGEGQLISRAWINRARSRWDAYVAQFGLTPPKAVLPVMGLDVAEMGVDKNVLTTRYGGFVLPFDVWSGIDIIETADMATDYYNRSRASYIAVDGTGVGSGVVPQIERNGIANCYSVKMSSRPTIQVEQGEFTHMRDQLWWTVREWLRVDPSAMLPPDEELIEELITPTYDTISGKLKVMKKEVMKELLRRSPDKAESLILSFYDEVIEPEEATGVLAQALLQHRGQ